MRMRVRKWECGVQRAEDLLNDRTQSSEFEFP